MVHLKAHCYKGQAELLGGKFAFHYMCHRCKRLTRWHAVVQYIITCIGNLLYCSWYPCL
jgi:hypothetical protein